MNDVTLVSGFATPVGAKVSGTVTGATASTVTDTSKSLTANAHIGRVFRIVSGKGAGQFRWIKSNTTNSWTIFGTWDTIPDSTSVYHVGLNLTDAYDASVANSWGVAFRQANSIPDGANLVPWRGQLYFTCGFKFGDGVNETTFGDLRSQTVFAGGRVRDYAHCFIGQPASDMVSPSTMIALKTHGAVPDQAGSAHRSISVDTNGKLYLYATALELSNDSNVAVARPSLINFGYLELNDCIIGSSYYISAGSSGTALGNNANGTMKIKNSILLQAKHTIDFANGTSMSIIYDGFTLVEGSTGGAIQVFGRSGATTLDTLTLKGIKIKLPQGFYINFRTRSTATLSATIIFLDSDIPDLDAIGWEGATERGSKVGHEFTYNLTVNDENDAPLENARVYIEDLDGNEIYNALTPSTGKITPTQLRYGIASWSAGDIASWDMSTPHVLKIGKLGKIFENVPLTASSTLFDIKPLKTNPYVSETDAEIIAHTGIAFSVVSGALVINLSTEKTAKQIYNRYEWWRAQEENIHYPEFIKAVSEGLFHLGTTRIVSDVGGKLIMDEENGMFKQGQIADGTKGISTNGGKIKIGTETSKSRILDFEATGTTTGFISSENWAQLYIDATGELEWLGGELQSHGAIAFYGKVRANGENCSFYNNGKKYSAGFLPQVRLRGADVQITSLATSGFVLVPIVIPTVPFSGVRGEETDELWAPSSSSPSNEWIIVTSAIADSVILGYPFWSSKWMSLDDSLHGLDYTIGGHFVTPHAGNKGLNRSRQRVKFNIPTGAVAYMRSTDHGSRLAANQIGTNPDLRPIEDYKMVSVDSVATGNIVLGYTYMNVAGAVVDPYEDNHLDSHGKYNDTTDRWDQLVLQMGKKPFYDMKVVRTKELGEEAIFDPSFDLDLGATETNHATIMAYTGFSGEGENTMTSGSTTTSKGYDRRKALELSNPDWVFDNDMKSYCSSASGLQYDFDSSFEWTITGTLSGKKITGVNLILETGWAITCPIDGVTITLPSTDYDLRGLDISGTLTLVNTSGTDVYVKVGRDVTVDTDGDTTIHVSREIDTFITAPNITNARYVAHNETTNQEVGYGTVSGSGISQAITIDDDHHNIGDTIKLSVTYRNGATAKKTKILRGLLTADGVSFIESLEDNTVYNAIGIDGSTVTGITADGIDIEVDIDEPLNKKHVHALYAWWVYNEDTYNGLRIFAGGLVPDDMFNFRKDTDVVDWTIDNRRVADLVIYGARLYSSDNSSLKKTGTNPITLDPDKAYTASDIAVEVSAIKEKTDRIKDESQVATEDDVVANS